MNTAGNSTEAQAEQTGIGFSPNGHASGDAGAGATLGSAQQDGRTPATSGANKALLDYTLEVLQENRRQARMLYNKLRITYAIVVALSVLMFLLGLALLSAPLWPLAQGKSVDWTHVLPAGIGLVDLVTLYLFGPVSRIQKLMGDMSQLTIVLGGYQITVALRLLEARLKEPPTLGRASVEVGMATRRSLQWVEKYFEKGLTAPIEKS
jgi:hypothetical protein